MMMVCTRFVIFKLIFTVAFHCINTQQLFYSLFWMNVLSDINRVILTFFSLLFTRHIFFSIFFLLKVICSYILDMCLISTVLVGFHIFIEFKICMF